MKDVLLETLKDLFPKEDPDFLFALITENVEKYPEKEETEIFNIIIERLFQDDASINEPPLDEIEDVTQFYHIIRRTWCSEPIYILKNDSYRNETYSGHLASLDRARQSSVLSKGEASIPKYSARASKAKATQPDLLPFVLTFFTEPIDVHHLPIYYRQQAAQLWHLRSDSYNKASASYQKHKNNIARPVAMHYVEEAKKISRQIESFHSMAGYVTLLQYNDQVTNSVDLHGLYVDQVLQFLYPLLFK